MPKKRILSPRLRQLLASRAPVIMLVTPERVRGQRAVDQLNDKDFPLDVRRWNIIDGFHGNEECTSFDDALRHIRSTAADEPGAKRMVAWLLEDAHMFL